jgi:hypothetical protein
VEVYMKVAILVNKSEWLDSSIERFVRAAIRGKSDKIQLASPSASRPETIRVVAEQSDTIENYASYGHGGGSLRLVIGGQTGIERLANAGRRPQLPKRLLDDLFRRVRGILFDAQDRRDQRTPPMVVGRKPKSAPTKKPSTPMEKAQARLDDAEKRVRKYESLLARAKRDASKRRGYVKRLEKP